MTNTTNTTNVTNKTPFERTPGVQSTGNDASKRPADQRNTGPDSRRHDPLDQELLDEEQAGASGEEPRNTPGSGTNDPSRRGRNPPSSGGTTSSPSSQQQRTKNADNCGCSGDDAG